jgi:PleD family two-component response regulator
MRRSTVAVELKLLETATHRHSRERKVGFARHDVSQQVLLGADHWGRNEIFERWDMASAVTARILDENSANIALTFGKKPDQPNSDRAPTVFVITDDISEEESLKSLITRQGWQFEMFESANEFLARPRPLVPSRLILARSLRDLNGLEEPKQIAWERAKVPIIVISRSEDIPTIVEAMKADSYQQTIDPIETARPH